MQDKSIINWDLHQKIMAKKKIIKICTGVGLDQITPEYITIEIPSTDIGIKKSKTTKKNG